jgi:hypothetical protein
MNNHTTEHEIMERELSKRDVLCIDCKHYQYISIMGSRQCMNDKNMAKSLENGALYSRFPAGYLRDDDNRCGVSAKWFEKKEET